MACSSIPELVYDLAAIDVDVSSSAPDFSNSKRPSDGVIDRWAETAALAEPEARSVAIWAIREAAIAAGLIPSSIQELYLARAAGKWSGRTVPAMNLRGWTYHTCRAAFRAAKEMDAALFVFEQAVSEFVFAEQHPVEYTAGVLAAALREGYTGRGLPSGRPCPDRRQRLSPGQRRRDPAARNHHPQRDRGGILQHRH